MAPSITVVVRIARPVSPTTAQCAHAIATYNAAPAAIRVHFAWPTNIPRPARAATLLADLGIRTIRILIWIFAAIRTQIAIAVGIAWPTRG